MSRLNCSEIEFRPPVGCNEETARQAKVLTETRRRMGNRCSTLCVSLD
jgi:hypothetical protein